MPDVAEGFVESEDAASATSRPRSRLAVAALLFLGPPWIVCVAALWVAEGLGVVDAIVRPLVVALLVSMVATLALGVASPLEHFGATRPRGLVLAVIAVVCSLAELTCFLPHASVPCAGR
ncbi:hypothetical protein [Nannocystis punicea]|uniref:Uncharacterized protein n=1 Tax=Nannocystis punicea TaxID=2995304 RepID=A0ABY7GX47_9BACT|nr:hypothetical protein [Nannocystis poenicansa]WAS91556.1 hypothetical protein O0S08_35690 [Nannocystis poenicansa]